MGSDERERTMYNVIVLIIIYLMRFYIIRSHRYRN